MLSSVFFPLPSPASLFPSFLVHRRHRCRRRRRFALSESLGCRWQYGTRTTSKSIPFSSPFFFFSLALIYGLHTTAEAAKKEGKEEAARQDSSLSLWRANNNSRESSRDLVPGAEVEEEESRRSTEYREWEEEEKEGMGNERMKLGYEICSSVWWLRRR